MVKKGYEVRMEVIPHCDFCLEPAEYDARMNRQQNWKWAWLCQRHFDMHTDGRLGLGKGQRLIPEGTEREPDNESEVPM